MWIWNICWIWFVFWSIGWGNEKQQLASHVYHLEEGLWSLSIARNAMFNPVSTNMHRYLGPRTQMTHMFEDLIHKMQGQSPSKHFSVGFPVIHFLLRHLHDMYNFSLVFSQLANYIGTAIPWHLGTGAIGSKQAIAKEDLATVAWLHFLEMGKPNPRNVNPPPWN